MYIDKLRNIKKELELPKKYVKLNQKGEIKLTDYFYNNIYTYDRTYKVVSTLNNNMESAVKYLVKKDILFNEIKISTDITILTTYEKAQKYSEIKNTKKRFKHKKELKNNCLELKDISDYVYLSFYFTTDDIHGIPIRSDYNHNYNSSFKTTGLVNFKEFIANITAEGYEVFIETIKGYTKPTIENCLDFFINGFPFKLVIIAKF